MWIFEGILYVILLLVFIRYDRKKRLWIKTVSQEEKFEHYLSELSAVKLESPAGQGFGWCYTNFRHFEEKPRKPYRARFPRFFAVVVK